MVARMTRPPSDPADESPRTCIPAADPVSETQECRDAAIDPDNGLPRTAIAASAPGDGARQAGHKASNPGDDARRAGTAASDLCGDTRQADLTASDPGDSAPRTGHTAPTLGDSARQARLAASDPGDDASPTSTATEDLDSEPPRTGLASVIPADLRRLPITLNRQGISVMEGLRAALSVAVIIAFDQVLDWGPLREAGLAALLTCICDPGGPIRRRVPILLSFGVLGALVSAGFGLARGLGMPVALPLGVFALGCASFARIYGSGPQTLGGLLNVVIVLSLDRALPSLGVAANVAAAFLGGSLWATLLTLVLWPIYPFLPARQAVATAYRSLAELAGDLRQIINSNPGQSDVWERHARAHRRAVRTALEAARTLVLDTVRSRGAAGARANQSLIRLETADQIFGALIGLGSLLEHATPAEHRAAEPMLRRLRPILVVLGEVILTDDPRVHRRVARSIDAMMADVARLPAGDPLRALGTRIAERLRIAQTLATPAAFLPGTDSTGRQVPPLQRLLQPLRANLAWRSPMLRHAVRAAIAAAPALALTMLWFNPYDHWLTITIVATMQPVLALTYARAVERVVGTALGGVVASVVGMLCTSKLAIAGAMFPLAVVAFTVRAVSLGLFMLTITPLVVLLVETGQPGHDGWWIALARATLTTIGGLWAVAAGFLLWPDPASPQLTADARAAIGAHARFAEAAFGFLLADSGADAVDQTRREAGVATNTLEATINRALLEPRSDRARLEATLVIDAALRRIAGRLSVMVFDPGPALPDPARRAWAAWVTTGLEAVASGQAVLAPRPTEPGNETILRLARQVELMAGVIGRLESRPASDPADLARRDPVAVGAR